MENPEEKYVPKKVPERQEVNSSLFCLLLTERIPFLIICFKTRRFTLLSCVISSYIFTFEITFIVNAMLFTNDVISEKYNSEKHKMKITKMLLLSGFTYIIVQIVYILIKKLFCFLNCLDYINAWPMDKEKINKIKELFIYTVKKRLLIFYALNFFVILFLIYYLSLFYIIYKKMFIEWLIDCIITNLIWVIVSFVLCCIVKIFDWSSRLFRTRGMINYIN